MLLSLLFTVLSGVLAAWASPRLRRSSDNIAPFLSSPNRKQLDQRTCLAPQRCCTKIGYVSKALALKKLIEQLNMFQPTENDLLPALTAAGVSIPDPNTIVGIGCFPSPVRRFH